MLVPPPLPLESDVDIGRGRNEKEGRWVVISMEFKFYKRLCVSGKSKERES
jgi:hypothetical protein